MLLRVRRKLRRIPVGDSMLQFGGKRERVPGLDDKTVLLVAGPSGSGKTVFITAFRSGRLAADIAALLPQDAQSWPQIGANDCMKRGVDVAAVLPKPWTAPGAVVHYDTAYIHRFGLERYEDDPIHSLFESVGRLVVVSIAPTAETLKAQFAARSERQRSGKKASHLFWKDRVRRPLERVVSSLTGRGPRETGELYQSPEWLRRCYAAWDLYAHRLVEGKPGSSAITLEPAGRAPDGASFLFKSRRQH
jgi:hypothetical protein